MHIAINGTQHEVDTGSNLQDLLNSLALAKGRIAVELNGEIVSRSTFPQLILNNGDSLEIVQAIGGG